MSEKRVVGIKFDAATGLPKVLFSAKGKAAEAYIHKARHLAKPIERMPDQVVNELGRMPGEAISQKNFFWLAKLYVKLLKSSKN